MRLFRHPMSASARRMRIVGPSLVVTVASTALACAHGDHSGEVGPRHVNPGGADSGVAANGGAANGGTTSSPTGGTPGSGGGVGSGGQRGGDSSATGGSAAGGAAGAAMDGSAGMGGAAGTATGGSAGMVSGGAAGASTGGSGGEAPCGTTQKRCNGACMERTPQNGCNSTACTACPGPAPANGLLTCNSMGECAFDCLPGYTISGNACAPSTGTGGTGGTGDGGTVRCGSTNCVPCTPPHITCCERTTGLSCLCAPPDYVATLCR